MSRKRSLSGIKPTGTPHLGNYFGMIQPAVALQETHDPFYFVADYHALTTGRDAKRLRESSYEVAATMLAAGLDPNRATLFRQSDVPEVVELAWHLACVTGTGLLFRAHAYKDAEAKGTANELSMGTFYYPVLMAADILLYDSDVVPVGKDQLQHIEMAQDMVTHLNAIYGNCLKRPEALVSAEVATIPGTDGRKMSKSYGNTIEIYLPPKKLRQAVMGIKTDSKGVDDPKDPETDNVFGLFKLVAKPEQVAAMAEKYREGKGYGYGHAKQELYEALEALLGPQRERYNALLAKPAELDEILDAGAARARVIARDVLARVRDRVGLPKLPSR